MVDGREKVMTPLFGRHTLSEYSLRLLSNIVLLFLLINNVGGQPDLSKKNI